MRCWRNLNSTRVCSKHTASSKFPCASTDSTQQWTMRDLRKGNSTLTSCMRMWEYAVSATKCSDLLSPYWKEVVRSLSGHWGDQCREVDYKTMPKLREIQLRTFLCRLCPKVKRLLYRNFTRSKPPHRRNFKLSMFQKMMCHLLQTRGVWSRPIKKMLTWEKSYILWIKGSQTTIFQDNFLLRNQHLPFALGKVEWIFAMISSEKKSQDRRRKVLNKRNPQNLWLWCSKKWKLVSRLLNH